MRLVVEDQEEGYLYDVKNITDAQEHCSDGKIYKLVLLTDDEIQELNKNIRKYEIIKRRNEIRRQQEELKEEYDALYEELECLEQKS